MRRVLHVLGPSEGGMRRHVRYLATHPPAGYETAAVAGPASLAAYFGGVRFVAGMRPAARGVDVVHAHGVRAATTSLGRTPLVVTLHVYAVAGGRGRLAQRVLRALAPAVAARADAVIAVSSQIASRVRGAVVIPPAVDLPGPPSRPRHDVRAELGASPDEPLALAVARLHADKRLSLVIDAARRAGVRTVIAGDGPQRADLERLAQSSPVRILGYRRDVADLLAAADLFVLSSVGEGYPIAAVEAIAAGLPVVATRVGAVPEIVRDAGVLVDPSDVDGFVRAVGALAADASRRAELAARARAVVLPPPDELVARIGAVYDGVVT